MFHASAGSYVFAGGLKLYSSHSTDLTVRLDNNNPAVTVQGDLGFKLLSSGDIDFRLGSEDLKLEGDVFDEVSGAGAVKVTPSTGSIVAQGTADQDWDWAGATGIGDVEIDKSAGKLTLSGPLDCTSLDVIDGELDPNGQDITTAVDLEIASGATVDVTGLPGTTWTIGGDLDIDGADLDAASAWAMSVAGSGTLHNLTISHCDASGGTRIDATDLCVDGGGNTNIRFAPMPSAVLGSVAVGPELVASVSVGACYGANVGIEAGYTADVGIEPK